jgi:hypothetical protein
MPTAENTNLGRSAGYCKKYRVVPANSPQILVTTHYPDAQGLGNYYVISLNGLDPNRSASVLDKLTNQLTQTGLNQKDIDETQLWNRILSASTAAISATGCYFNKVSMSLHFGFVNAEIGHSREGNC